MFAYLTGYTKLTEESGDEVAAGVSLKLAEVVSEVASRHDGHVVKMLGDGVHFHFARIRTTRWRRPWNSSRPFAQPACRRPTSV